MPLTAFIVELGKNLSVIIAAVSLILGIRAWKREYIGKRKIELAEDTLMLFYQARDAIRDIRNPFGRAGEGSSREQAANETGSEKQQLDRAYVVYERYKKHEDLFNKLHAARYRFMARFGREHEAIFIELNSVVHDIFIAAHMLGTYYWQSREREGIEVDELRSHIDEMHKHEAMFWFMGEENDKISPRVEAVINGIEKVTRETLAENNVRFKWIGEKR